MIETSRIYHENCIETLRRMTDDMLDMTITSPPYDDLRDYNGYHFPVEEISELLFEKTKPGGVVIWVVGDRTVNGSETLTSFQHALTFKSAGFKVHDTMIYAKNNPIPSDCGKRYRPCFEYMFCFSKGQPKTFNPITQAIKQEKAFKSFRITKVGRNDLAHDHIAPKERKVNNIFFYNVGTSSSRDKVAFEHPAIFPEQLAMDQISTWTDEGDLVYDCFMGSGTTAKAAHFLKRNWVGSEISDEYIRIAEDRLRPHLEKTGCAAVE
ncbi:MAG TPA: site-specific DNA-methyltransferase [Pyrinomonadaceae bacterium]|jgi:site-specific DNA-methyltransferase (adenine-specific)|nr:site-specific DNA-methyltransferase [Pyrinomonadaceae bacterium]